MDRSLIRIYIGEGIAWLQNGLGAFLSRNETRLCGRALPPHCRRTAPVPIGSDGGTLITEDLRGDSDGPLATVMVQDVA